MHGQQNRKMPKYTSLLLRKPTSIQIKIIKLLTIIYKLFCATMQYIYNKWTSVWEQVQKHLELKLFSSYFTRRICHKLRAPGLQGICRKLRAPGLPGD